MFFGLFTLLFWVAFLLETSFAATNIIALAAFVAAIASIVAATRPVSSALDDCGENRWPPGKLILIAAAAGLGASTNLIDDVTLYWLVLVAAAAVLIVGLRSDFRPGEQPERRGGEGPLWPLAALCIAAAAIVLVSHRPDADDEFFLRIALSFLERPNASLADITIIQSAYGLASYYGFAAWFSRLTGLPLLDIYYLIFQPIAAVLSVMANYRLFRELTARPIVATAVVIAVYLLWADMHTAPGNFAYVRLFQGKAVFTIVVVPMVLTYAIRNFRHRGWRTPLLLNLCGRGGNRPNAVGNNRSGDIPPVGVAVFVCRNLAAHYRRQLTVYVCWSGVRLAAHIFCRLPAVAADLYSDPARGRGCPDGQSNARSDPRQ